MSRLTKRIVIELSIDDHQKLVEHAKSQRRSPQDQAAIIVEDHLGARVRVKPGATRYQPDELPEPDADYGMDALPSSGTLVPTQAGSGSIYDLMTPSESGEASR